MEEGPQQLIDLNSSEYQTVTIVPSEGSTGEVSYVLIVQQNETEPGQISVEQDINPDPEHVEMKKPQPRPKPKPLSKKLTKSEEEDLTVYDFEEVDEVDPIGEEAPSTIEEDVDEKPKLSKLNKKQVVAPAHMCNYCNYTSPKRYLLARHLKSHSEERPHKCSVCERGFKTIASLQNHINTHTGVKPHKCKYCESRFTTSGELVRHVRYKHTHEKPHKCSICDYASVELSKMRNHMRSHTGERPYQLHCKSHEGEKCWKCELCPYASSSQRHLESHMLIHTDQKPYLCDHCDQTFRQKQLLKRHVNLYHNPHYVPPSPKEKTHKCPECKKAFRHKGNLLRHMTLHDPDSELIEQQVALKLGRQKKVHIIDGHKVEVIPDDEEEEEGEETEEEEEGGGEDDGHQYVVLEVIQVQSEDGTQQNVAVVPASSLMGMGATINEHGETGWCT
ncbi:transcriptional repressor CTCFL-like [Diaphorina citri]|uniref:Transcriptional repressor CTCFL-like n=1 Tax=Diaphorina citri TaxID=121845 RepID=A0A3Q0JIC2_DIACI|nr:transcriptional repressor CTCFL-like [Diaphorina citri]